ncbi:hypothetical protein [Pseudanabaena sp. FACHB-2040]|uniref:hypothetical protein n=1 Tax=Pseudanabaena sp. FACHB-2040 TaxID=2692859 RepID=UPI001684A72B|nr:hypothetical protein [Pseudanabaena sp. FACHB-2040]MBD2261395.1 hypothetical protein [Pseudanabaena sp. FACHB-2040]
MNSNFDQSFQEAAFETAKNYIGQLADRPDLLKKLATEIAEVAPPGSLPQRLQPKKMTR